MDSFLREMEAALPGLDPWRPLHVVSEVVKGASGTGDAGACIRYGQCETPFGVATLAWTEQGICALIFDPETGLNDLHEALSDWRGARLVCDAKAAVELGASIFRPDFQTAGPLNIHLCGTAFQLRVWEALLRIPAGYITSYGQLAAAIGQVGAGRAVGSAVARNRIGWLVPCHRVIRKGGGLGEYRWGRERKRLMLACEAQHLSAGSGGA